VSIAVKHIPEQVQAQVTHRFEGRLKWMLIIITGAILITASSLSLWIGSLRANSRLVQQDIKYRYLKKVTPLFTLHADTLFLNDPKGFTNTVQKWELQQERVRQAQQEYQQKQKEADEAKKKLKQMK